MLCNRNTAEDFLSFQIFDEIIEINHDVFYYMIILT